MSSAADVRRWASAVPGLADRLERGGRVAVIGCGRGETTVALARAFPACVISAFDHRPAEIAVARLAAAAAGVSDRVTFETAEPWGIRGAGYDLIWYGFPRFR